MAIFYDPNSLWKFYLPLKVKVIDGITWISIEKTFTDECRVYKSSGSHKVPYNNAWCHFLQTPIICESFISHLKRRPLMRHCEYQLKKLSQTNVEFVKVQDHIKCWPNLTITMKGNKWMKCIMQLIHLLNCILFIPKMSREAIWVKDTYIFKLSN